MLNILHEKYKILIDCHDNNRAYIRVSAPTSTEVASPINFLYVSLTYFDESVRHTWGFKNHITDGRLYLFNREDQSFSLGLTAKIVKMLKERFPNYEIAITPNLREKFTPPGGKVPVEKFDSTLR